MNSFNRKKDTWGNLCWWNRFYLFYYALSHLINIVALFNLKFDYYAVLTTYPTLWYILRNIKSIGLWSFDKSFFNNPLSRIVYSIHKTVSIIWSQRHNTNLIKAILLCNIIGNFFFTIFDLFGEFTCQQFLVYFLKVIQFSHWKIIIGNLMRIKLVFVSIYCKIRIFLFKYSTLKV